MWPGQPECNPGRWTETHALSICLIQVWKCVLRKDSSRYDEACTLGITKSDHSPWRAHQKKHSNHIMFIGVLKNISDRHKQSNPLH